MVQATIDERLDDVIKREALQRDIDHVDDRIDKLQLLSGQEDVISALAAEQKELRKQLAELESHGSRS